MEHPTCRLKKQGRAQGSCRVQVEGKHAPACQATLRHQDGVWQRRITSIHLSRPENYLSIYQSGCNFSCRKCHSWYFSNKQDGDWYSPQDILQQCLGYEKFVNCNEPRQRATAWHAQDSCRSCGSCVLHGRRSRHCPGILDPPSILLGPQGFGPARNIVAFTGGDLTCCPGFYEACSRLIKSLTGLWVLIETNGYALTAKNLDCLQAAGVDAFWLDIKAHNDETHQWLTGCSNRHILKLPEKILERGFTLEVLSLYIPGLVESGELEKIARDLAVVDESIPFTILAFLPEHRMKTNRAPHVREMVDAYARAKSTGLKHIRLGNLGVFVHNEKDREFLCSHVDVCAL